MYSLRTLLAISVSILWLALVGTQELKAKTVTEEVSGAGLLKRSAALYRGSTGLSGKVVEQVEIWDGSKLSKERTTADFYQQRSPAKALISIRSKQGQGAISVDDNKAVFYQSDWKKFSKTDKLTTLNALEQNADANFVANGLLSQSLLPAILSGNFDTDGSIDLESAKVLNDQKPETIGGVKCYKVHVQLNGSPVTLWVQRGPEAFIRRVQPFDKTKIGDGHMTMTFTYSNVRSEAKRNRLKFVLPPLSSEVSHFVVTADDESHHPMLGQSVSKIEFESPSGALVTLKTGKVHVLEFWATWCGPCREALAVLSDLQTDYGDRIECVAINRNEGREVVREFLAKSKFEFLVGIDKDEKLAHDFHVGGIPQTVVIGPDGTVKAVHIGFSSADSYRQLLKKEIDSVIN